MEAGDRGGLSLSLWWGKHAEYFGTLKGATEKATPGRKMRGFVGNPHLTF